MYAAPRLPRDFLVRPRLLRALDGESRLVIVRAPAGSGKTVAVASWAQDRGDDAPGMWFTAGRDCSSREAFWREVIQLLIDAGYAPEGSLLRSTIDVVESVPDLARVLVRGFTQLERELVLVIDNAQEIADDRVYSDLSDVAERTGVRVVVVTRTVSPLEERATARAASCVVVPPDALLFTPDETARILELARVADPTGSVATSVHESSNGVPFVVRGAVVALQRGDFDATRGPLDASLTTLASRQLRDVLLNDSFSAEDAAFAIRCSVASTVTVELARALTQRDDAEQLLSDAEKYGIGLWEISGGEPQFRFSPSVLAMLREALEARMSGELPHLHRLAAEWSIDHRQPFSALHHAVAAGDLELASNFVKREFALVGSINSPVVIDVLSPIPLRTLRRYPVLVLLLALSYNRTGVHRVRALELMAVAAVAARVRGSRAPIDERVLMFVIEAAALRVSGKFDQALDRAKQVVALLEQLTVAQRDDLVGLLPMIYNHVGLCFFYGGDTLAARDLFRAAHALPAGSPPTSWFHSLALYCGTVALRGDLVDAARVAERARDEPWPGRWRDDYYGCLYQVAEAMIALEAGDTDRALEHLATMDRHLDTIEHWSIIMHVRALVELTAGRARAGAAVLRSAMAEARHPVHGKAVAALLDSTLALVHLAAADVVEASTLLGRHSKRRVPVGLAWARLHLVTNEPELALADLRGLDATDTSPRTRASFVLLRAAASLRVGRGDAALADLDEALAVLSERGMRHPFLMLPRADRVALAELAGRAGSEGFARVIDDELVAARDLWPNAAPRVQLTNRERSVLERLEHTASAGEIAAALFISVNTVKTHQRLLYRKLGVSSRDEALVAARELGFLE